MKVFLSPLAEFKLTKLLAYLEEEWGKQSKEKFLKKLEEKFKQISSHPKSNPQAENFEKVFWCVVTPKAHSITGNRQNPDKSIREIRSYFKT